MIPEELETLLDRTFKSIRGHLKSINIKEFNRLKKQALYLNYDSKGEFLGTTDHITHLIQVKINEIKNKGDIQRYVNLIKEELELDIIRTLTANVVISREELNK